MANFDNAAGLFRRQRTPSLQVATGGAGPLPLITRLIDTPITVVDVSSDARYMRRPSTLLTFMGVICMPPGESVSLNFEIVRCAGEECVTVGPTFTFMRIAPSAQTESFSFQFYDAKLAPDLYTYGVRIAAGSLVDIEPGLTIRHATLSALSVESAKV